MAFTRPFESPLEAALRVQGPGGGGMEGFFHFLDDQYEATEGGLAARRFPKGISDPWKNPWRDFSSFLMTSTKPRRAA